MFNKKKPKLFTFFPLKMLKKKNYLNLLKYKQTGRRLKKDRQENLHKKPNET